MRPFEILEPTSVAEASTWLAEHGDSARIYAGGTELLLVLKEGLLHYDYLVNIKTIPQLDEVYYDAIRRRVHIGALATHRQLERSDLLRQYLPTLAYTEAHVANVRVRNVGTIGGNLCFAEPHADPGTVLLLHDATVLLESRRGERELPITEFFVDMFTVALTADEILTEIRVPLLPEGSASTYLKFGYLERPSVGVGMVLTLDEDRLGVVNARIAVGCAGPVPRRVPEAEALLTGLELSEALARVREAGEVAARQTRMISDLHGSADYKRHLVRSLVERAAAVCAMTFQSPRADR